MGHYFIRHSLEDGKFSSKAILTKYGYCVINERRYDTLISKVRDSAEFINGESSIFPNGILESAGYSVLYPYSAISLSEAKSKYPKFLAREKLEFDLLFKLLQESDLNFSMKEIGIPVDNICLPFVVLSCFLEGSKRIGVEVVGNSLRVFKQPSIFVGIFSSQRTGDTLFSLSEADIKDITVGSKVIGIKLRNDSSCGIGRDGYGAPGCSWNSRV
jgi:hypothetical protein